jgi:hypothetical protein
MMESMLLRFVWRPTSRDRREGVLGRVGVGVHGWWERLVFSTIIVAFLEYLVIGMTAES